MSVEEEVGFDAALKQALELSLVDVVVTKTGTTSPAVGMGNNHDAHEYTTGSDNLSAAAPRAILEQEAATPSPLSPTGPNPKRRKYAVDSGSSSPLATARFSKRPSDDFTKAFEAKEAQYAKAGARVDRYSQPPPKASNLYVSKNGQLLLGIHDPPYHELMREKPLHPKLKEAVANGTLTAEKYEWYKSMPPNVNIPVAGIASDKPRRPKRGAPNHGAPNHGSL
jgi:hypothetical protein